MPKRFTAKRETGIKHRSWRWWIATWNCVFTVAIT